jgi:hypothetical protein
MEFDELEGYVQHVVNNHGRREYEDAYDRTKSMSKDGKSREEVERAIIRDPDQPKPNQDGQVTMIHRKAYEANRRLAEFRTRAIADALQGKPQSYRD